MPNQQSFPQTRDFQCIARFLHHSLQTKNLEAIKKLHARLLVAGSLSLSLSLHTRLIFAYSCCRHSYGLRALTTFFRRIPSNPFPFNLILADFCRNGLPFLALRTFSFMHANSIALDTYALCGSLTASSSIKDVETGKQIHAHVAKLGWSSSVFVGSALIDLYAKSLYIRDASYVFDEIPQRNAVCANALLSGFCETKLWAEGLELVGKMTSLNLNFDNFTLSAMLRVCAGLTAFELGRQVHGKLFRVVSSMKDDIFLQSCLIEMYGKCGSVEKALRVFNSKGICGIETKKDVVLWTSMLGVYGRNGQFEQVIELFKDMLMGGIRPDGVAFLAVLSACNHTGQMEQAFEYLESMALDFGLDPGPEHYSCLVDLFCRAGELEKAWKLVNQVSYKGNGCCNVSMWGALLNACLEYGNVDLGKLAARRALELNPQNVGIFVLLSNLYARLGMWDEIGELRELVKGKGLKKEFASSWIEVTA